MRNNRPSFQSYPVQEKSEVMLAPNEYSTLTLHNTVWQISGHIRKQVPARKTTWPNWAKLSNCKGVPRENRSGVLIFIHSGTERSELLTYKGKITSSINKEVQTSFQECGFFLFTRKYLCMVKLTSMVCNASSQTKLVI